MQSIEIYTPLRDDAQGKFTGLNHEAILYDPEALVDPIRIVERMDKRADFADAEVNPIVFTECIQTIYPVEGTCNAPHARSRHRVRSARHVRPPVGPDVGEVLGKGHEEAREGRPVRLQQGARQMKIPSAQCLCRGAGRDLLLLRLCRRSRSSLPPRRLLEQVAAAMGGRERLQRIDTLVYTGFGQDAYMDGGGNITADVNAPPKWRAIADAQRSIDLKSRAAVLQQRRAPMFPFAAPFGLNWNRRLSAAGRRRPARSSAAGSARGAGSGFASWVR